MYKRQIAASDLKNIGNATTGTVTVDNLVKVTGNQADVTAALVTEASKVVFATGNTLAEVSNAVTAAQGQAIAATTNISAAFAGGVTDSVANLYDTNNSAISTNYTAIKNDDSDVDVTVDDDAFATSNSTIAAAKLSAIGNATTGTVTVSNAVKITGSQSDVTGALVTEASKVSAGSALVTISDNAFANTNSTIAASDLKNIGNATSGAVTVTNAIKITGSQSDVCQ